MTAINTTSFDTKLLPEEALRRSLKELADIKFALDESAIVAITDQRGIINYVNDKFCEISKYSREDLLVRITALLTGISSERVHQRPVDPTRAARFGV